MRRIGTISQEALAQRFVDYLYSEGIAAHVDAGGCETFAVWVEDEDRVEDARAFLARYVDDPEAAQYRSAGEKAEKLRKSERRAEASFSRQVFDRDRIVRRATWSAIPVTRILILLSVAATAFGGLGSDSVVAEWLLISRCSPHQAVLPEIMAGQVWRLFTPMFLHASLLGGGIGFLHILFNMLWLMDLGGIIERVQGGWSLLIKVLVIGGLSNLLQYYVAGPAFGGMSGVVFGLLGYSWMRGRQDVTSGLFVHPRIMFMMTFWFFLGFTGMMGPIANAAHGGGLAVGLFWGYVSSTHVHVRRG